MPTAAPDPHVHPARPGTTRRDRHARPRLLLVAAAVLVTAAAMIAVPARTASASAVVQANGVTLSTSATCARGDVQIDYAADGITRQAVSLTSQAGATLDQYESAAYKSVYTGSEFILTDANVPAADGTVLGVYVTLGATPPAATNAEFFLLYRCDPTRNDKGGLNTVLMTCFGDYGTCPATAQAALAGPTTTTTPMTTPTTGAGTPDPTVSPDDVAVPVTGAPTFTG